MDGTKNFILIEYNQLRGANQTKRDGEQRENKQQPD